MAKSDGFDHDMATVVMAGVSTDEAKLIMEVAYGNDRCIKEWETPLIHNRISNPVAQTANF